MRLPKAIVPITVKPVNKRLEVRGPRGESLRPVHIEVVAAQRGVRGFAISTTDAAPYPQGKGVRKALWLGLTARIFNAGRLLHTS